MVKRVRETLEKVEEDGETTTEKFASTVSDETSLGKHKTTELEETRHTQAHPKGRSARQ